MNDSYKSYRIRTNIGKEAPIKIDVPLTQTCDMFEVLSLKIAQENLYKMPVSDYGIIIGRVYANGGVGVENAKLSIFIPYTDSEDLKKKILYNYTSINSKNNDGVEYNLLQQELDDICHQPVGTFPDKNLVLDNNIIIEIFDQYYKYTTRTNKAGDYMIFGVPTGNQQLHMNVDLSDIGVLSQKPRDFAYKGYNIELFENPNKFKTDKNLNTLAQVITQNKTIFVYPFWGDTGYTDTNASITRCDIQIDYKFEPTCIFMGSVITDTNEDAINKRCIPSETSGKMSNLVTGDGTIEMIRKTIDNQVEEFSIKGNQLIDENGIWCYQIPMNLDYITTDEYGDIIPTDNPDIGIPTRTKVRFRVSLGDFSTDGTAKKRAKFLIPNNPKIDNDRYPDYSNNHNIDFEFGSFTKDENFRDLFWNKVYTVKSYIPRLQRSKSPATKKFIGIKGVNYFNDNNPIPFNNLFIKYNFRYRIMCTLTRFLIMLITIINKIITPIGKIFYEIYVWLAKTSNKYRWRGKKNAVIPLQLFISNLFCYCGCKKMSDTNNGQNEIDNSYSDSDFDDSIEEGNGWSTFENDLHATRRHYCQVQRYNFKVRNNLSQYNCSGEQDNFTAPWMRYKARKKNDSPYKPSTSGNAGYGYNTSTGYFETCMTPDKYPLYYENSIPCGAIDEDNDGQNEFGGLCVWFYKIFRRIGLGIPIQSFCEEEETVIYFPGSIYMYTAIKYNSNNEFGSLHDFCESRGFNSNKEEKLSNRADKYKYAYDELYYIDNNNENKPTYVNDFNDDGKITLDNIKYDISRTMNCMENSLARENECINFNFQNDWINGVLYAPMWFRKIYRKDTYFFGTKKIKQYKQYCNGYPPQTRKLKVYNNCALPRSTEQGNDNFLTPVKEEPEFHWIISGLLFEKKIIGEINSSEDGCFGYQCDRLGAYTKIDYGIICEKETLRGDKVYYYKPCEYMSSSSNDTDNHITRLLATDLVLLGSLNDCDNDGTPQFFKYLESTTYNMPPDLIDTYKINDTDDTDNNTDDNADKFNNGEISGKDWGENSSDQCEGHGGDTNLYAAGGLFYGLTCSMQYTKPKTCVNVSRICEFGVSLDESISIIKNVNGDTYNIPPDGFISHDELYANNERSMFATMNWNDLKVTTNQNTGFLSYDFNPLFMDNFDGSSKNLMKKEHGLPNCDETPAYVDNYELEQANNDYYKFRFYYKDESDGVNYYNNNLVELAGKSKDKNSLRIPLYNNSLYFYFGLKYGKTAIDKFRKEFYSDCVNNEPSKPSVNITYEPNLWCDDSEELNRGGYIMFNIVGIDMPYHITFKSWNTGMIYFSDELNNENVIFCNPVNPPEIIQDFNGQIGTLSYEDSNNNIVLLSGMLPNDDYKVVIIDQDENEYTQNISFLLDTCQFTAEVKHFNVKNSYYYGSHNPNERHATYINVAELIDDGMVVDNDIPVIHTDISQLVMLTVYNRRKKGGFIVISDISLGNNSSFRLKIEPYNHNDFNALETGDIYIDGNNTQFTNNITYTSCTIDRIYDGNNYVLYYIGDNHTEHPYDDEFYTDDVNNPSKSKPIAIIENKNIFVFGVPKGNVYYKVTLQEICLDNDPIYDNSEGKNKYNSNNIVTKIIYVSEGSDMNLLINGIDYNFIKYFDAGYTLQDVTESSGIINHIQIVQPTQSIIPNGIVKGWIDIENTGLNITSEFLLNNLNVYSTKKFGYLNAQIFERIKEQFNSRYTMYNWYKDEYKMNLYEEIYNRSNNRIMHLNTIEDIMRLISTQSNNNIIFPTIIYCNSNELYYFNLNNIQNMYSNSNSTSRSYFDFNNIVSGTIIEGTNYSCISMNKQINKEAYNCIAWDFDPYLLDSEKIEILTKCSEIISKRESLVNSVKNAFYFVSSDTTELNLSYYGENTPATFAIGYINEESTNYIGEMDLNYHITNNSVIYPVSIPNFYMNDDLGYWVYYDYNESDTGENIKYKGPYYVIIRDAIDMTLPIAGIDIPNIDQMPIKKEYLDKMFPVPFMKVKSPIELDYVVWCEIEAGTIPYYKRININSNTGNYTGKFIGQYSSGINFGNVKGMFAGYIKNSNIVLSSVKIFSNGEYENVDFDNFTNENGDNYTLITDYSNARNNITYAFNMYGCHVINNSNYANYKTVNSLSAPEVFNGISFQMEYVNHQYIDIDGDEYSIELTDNVGDILNLDIYPKFNTRVKSLNNIDNNRYTLQDISTTFELLDRTIAFKTGNIYGMNQGTFNISLKQLTENNSYTEYYPYQLLFNNNNIIENILLSEDEWRYLLNTYYWKFAHTIISGEIYYYVAISPYKKNSINNFFTCNWYDALDLHTPTCHWEDSNNNVTLSELEEMSKLGFILLFNHKNNDNPGYYFCKNSRNNIIHLSFNPYASIINRFIFQNLGNSQRGFIRPINEITNNNEIQFESFDGINSSLPIPDFKVKKYVYNYYNDTATSTDNYFYPLDMIYSSNNNSNSYPKFWGINTTKYQTNSNLFGVDTKLNNPINIVYHPDCRDTETNLILNNNTDVELSNSFNLKDDAYYLITEYKNCRSISPVYEFDSKLRAFAQKNINDYWIVVFGNLYYLENYKFSLYKNDGITLIREDIILEESIPSNTLYQCSFNGKRYKFKITSDEYDMCGFTNGSAILKIKDIVGIMHQCHCITYNINQF